MQRDPEWVAETRAWFVKAAQDLAAAEHEFRASPPLVEDIVFHAQQAVEKSFKGFLTWHGRRFRKTHNLEELGEQCLGLDSTLAAVVDKAVPLTEYAWRFRYPGEPEAPSREEAEEALRVAREVFDAVLSRLSVEVRP